jgi:hypothetical protein
VTAPGDRFGPFPVYIPSGTVEELSHVIHGSAIVGFPSEVDASMIHVYYEGNRYASPDLNRFADRVKHAAGRARWERFDFDQWRREYPDLPPPPTEHGFTTFPTAAQAMVRVRDLIQVAQYDDFLGLVEPLGLDERALLTDWIGSNAPAELVATGQVFELRRTESSD